MLTPRPYQLEGIRFLTERTRALLSWDMRLGKTMATILAAQQANHGAILVVCPAIAVPHWQREFKKWWEPGSPAPLVDIYSYDKARSLWQSGEIKNDYDTLIVDECHMAKNPEAQRTQMIYGKGGLGYQAGAIWALSGTPAPKHAGELWPMLKAFGATKMSYDDFIGRYCARWWNKQRREWVVKGTREDRIPELKELLAPIMLRRTRKDVAPEMPSIDFQFLEVQPATADLAIPPGLADDDLLGWLEAHATTDQENRVAVANAKVPALVEEIVFAIENDLLKQTVVFGWHREPLQVLAHQLNKRGIRCDLITGDTPSKKREQVQASFREGTTQVIAANILAAGTAIDLSAASHAYFVEMSWIPGDNLQAANRLVSMQKDAPVTVDVCTWPGSTDDRVQRVLTRRARELRSLLD